MARTIKLKKVLKEVWTKKRGSATKEFTGHVTQHYIDGVPVQKKDWDQQIQNNIIDEETFKLLTSPTYFNSLHWEKRRALLLEVCGDLSDNDVIENDKALSALPEILGNKSIEDQKKIITAKRREINQRLNEIPSRIDELDKSLADVSAYDVKAITAEIKELDKEIQALKDDTKASLLRKQKAELQAKLSELEMDKILAERKVLNAHNEKIDALEKEFKVKRAYVIDAWDQIAMKEQKIENNKERMNQLRDDYTELASRKAIVEDTCPTCGQAIPEDQVQEAIKKHNKRQAIQLADINEKGKVLKAENARLTQEIDAITKKGLTDEIEIKESERKIKELRALPVAVSFDMSAIDKIEGELQTIENTLSSNLAPDTSPLEEKRRTLQAMIAEVDAAEKTRVRIEELKVEEKNLATEYEELEREISLMEQFIVSKVDLLEDKINNRFSLARFKLFKQNINGGIEETCETLYEGVPYSTGLNSGAQTMIGCDIVKTLQKYYGILAPLWLDHAESCRYPISMDCQTIFLEVSQDKELKVENN